MPPRLRLERWALTPPFHPCLWASKRSPNRRYVLCGTVRRHASRRSLPCLSAGRACGYTASRPVVFGLSSPFANERSDPPPFQNQRTSLKLGSGTPFDKPVSAGERAIWDWKPLTSLPMNPPSLGGIPPRMKWVCRVGRICPQSGASGDDQTARWGHTRPTHFRGNRRIGTPDSAGSPRLGAPRCRMNPAFLTRSDSSSHGAPIPLA